MATALLLAAAILVKKNEDQTFLADYDINNLPALLVESLSRNIDASIYEEQTRIYNEAQLQFATSFVSAVPPDLLAHSDIDCITSVSAYSSLCGYTFDEFDRLFHSLRNLLIHLFPRSKIQNTPGNVHKYATRRMKLFMFLYRCKFRVE